jgi:transcriptional regulator with GAF, ATPase, and Fis domain/CHASE2 domain-containing sensor protein
MKSTNIRHLQKIIILTILALIFSIFSILPISLNKKIQNSTEDLLFLLRGSRDLSKKILFVFIGPEDVEALGGWPISRDYYAYLIHTLQLASTSTIGIDILLAKPDPQYEEFDRTLAEVMHSSANVCLPMTFSELSLTPSEKKMLSGIQPVTPMETFSAAAAGIGFSNLGNLPTIREAPIAVRSNDHLLFSFGAELARLYLGGQWSLSGDGRNLELIDSNQVKRRITLNDNGYLHLNHFGDINHCQSIGFLDLLELTESEIDALNLPDKLILVGVTAPGISILRSTALSGALPASLIHATVAENIIQQNYLRQLPVYSQWFIISILLGVLLLIWQKKNFQFIIVAEIALMIFLWIAGILLFNICFVSLPLFYPTIAFIIAALVLNKLEKQKRTWLDQSLKKLLEGQVAHKELELKQARHKLQEYQTLLENSEKQSEEISGLSESRQKAILQLENELRDLQSYMIPEKPEALPEFVDIIHAPQSKLVDSLKMIERIKSDDIPVLIMGETGTGKELLARAIHRTSRRKEKPFIAVNCGALTETLLESELFGHEKGSFTGAHSRRRGRFELANGGTIFLDEISETSPAFQSKLLRILQEGVFERVGGEQSIQVDVRIVAASNRELQAEMEKGDFRADLYYRLNAFPIQLPPLRERMEDIPLLVLHFLHKYDYSPGTEISDQAMEILIQYRWPGNVRELENAVRRAAILAKSAQRKLIQSGDLPEEIQHYKSMDVETDYQPLEQQILKTLQSFQFSHSAISQTARVLGNRDRGTITEYFRGICFEALVTANFDIEAAAQTLSQGLTPEATQRVYKKIQDYLNNLYPLPDLSAVDQSNLMQLTQFKKLPQKYHSSLCQVIQHLKKSNQ